MLSGIAGPIIAIIAAIHVPHSLLIMPTCRRHVSRPLTEPKFSVELISFPCCPILRMCIRSGVCVYSVHLYTSTVVCVCVCVCVLLADVRSGKGVVAAVVLSHQVSLPLYRQPSVPHKSMSLWEQSLRSIRSCHVQLSYGAFLHVEHPVVTCQPVAILDS